MKRFSDVARTIVNAILGEDTPVAADVVRQIRKNPLAIQ